jgi:hypothetical protein
VNRRNWKKILDCAVVCAFAFGIHWSSTSGVRGQAGPARTSDGVVHPNLAVPGAHYTGPAACAQCHADKFKSQHATPMGAALRLPKESEVLRDHPHLNFSQGPYSYKIDSSAGKTTFTVTDGTATISEPVPWAFGLGVAGQTYVFQHNGRYIEGRVSYYSGVKNLDITVGHPTDVPRSLEDALGRSIGIDETRACFGCHTTAAVTQRDMDLSHAIPGVTCEACHGPGEKHIASAKSGKVEENGIFNPGTLGTEELLNFCGACHRTWEQVGLLGLRGVNNVRFQPYRLTNSKCYDADDRRISCLACHDPHEDLKRGAAYYDSKCTACHTSNLTAAKSGNRIARICPVGKEQCTSCHMPKFELPGGHYRFSDHDIRVVREGDSYPN